MSRFPFILSAFIAVPLLEIYLILKVGGLIGALPTVLCIVLTAVIGTALLRAQGMRALRDIQDQLHQGQLPTVTMLEGVFLLTGGLLLLTPGFFTDTIGFLCLVPPLRRWLIHRFGQHLSVKTASFSSGIRGDSSVSNESGRVFEGEVTKSSHRQDH